MSQNPPAFPTMHHPDSFEGNGQSGMSLRDYFAGLAIPAFAARGRRGHAPAAIIAAACYELADAMLAARSQASSS